MSSLADKYEKEEGARRFLEKHVTYPDTRCGRILRYLILPLHSPMYKALVQRAFFGAKKNEQHHHSLDTCFRKLKEDGLLIESKDNDRRRTTIEVPLTSLWLYLLKTRPSLFHFGDKVCNECNKLVYYITIDESELIREETSEYSETYLVCPHCKIAHREGNFH